MKLDKPQSVSCLGIPNYQATALKDDKPRKPRKMKLSLETGCFFLKVAELVGKLDYS